jgi:hypothetical protein
MTVAELIEKLKGMPPEAPVYMKDYITEHHPALGLASAELVDVCSDEYPFDRNKPTRVTVLARSGDKQPTTKAVLIEVSD